MSKGDWSWFTTKQWQSSSTSSKISSSNKHLDEAIQNVADHDDSSSESESEESMISFSSVNKKRKFQTKPTGKKLAVNIAGIGQHKMPKTKKMNVTTKNSALYLETQSSSTSNVKMSSKQINQVAQQVVKQLGASTSHYDSDTDESSSLEKTRIFQTTPMGKKRISKIGGIGQLSGEKLNDLGIRYAEQLFGKFLLIGPEKEAVFKRWLASKTELPEFFQNECYQSLFGYYQNFFE